MYKRSAIVAALLLAVPFSLTAKEITGKIQSAVHQTQTIKYLNPKTKEISVIKYDDKTVLVDAEDFHDLEVNTKFKAEVDENGYASKIKRVLVKLPADQVIDTDTLSDMLDEGEAVFIGDARPLNVYQVGHLPGAKATPANKLKENLDWLPADKDMLVVFYCGGVTCPLSPAALKIAKENGYSNVKAYVEGFPAWKADIYPAHVNADWLKNNLDKHHVVLDVRDEPDTFVKGAVHMPVAKLAEMHDTWNKEKYPKAKRTIFNLRDKKAPIVVVADSDDADEAIEAYELLSFWDFKNVTILSGGIQGWAKAGLPTGEGAISTKLVYEKKLMPGAVTEAEFAKAAKEGSAVIIDVRSAEEISSGKIKDALNLPLETLDQHLASVAKDKPVYLYCASGARASMAYTLLTTKGFTNVKFLNDSFMDIAKDKDIPLI